MVQRLQSIATKEVKYVIGLMSGTSVDGIDAALVKISGNSVDTKVEEIAFKNYPYSAPIKERIFHLFNDATARDICHMNFLLGNLFAEAALDITNRAGLDSVDLIGSHGQTIYHIPEPIDADYPIKSTMQIGEGAVIAHKTSAVTVTDFRVADMAAGGIGAPLVPYVDFLLYSESSRTVAMQNIGGIGNITVIPKGAASNDVIAFDTGPGNMIIDYLTNKTTGMDYDANGDFAAKGKTDIKMLAKLMQNEYIHTKPPKATGRELFGEVFSEQFYADCKAAGLRDEDIIATATAFTAESIAFSIRQFIPHKINKLVVCGGGAYNKTMLRYIKERLPEATVLTQEEEGKNSDAKEAIAFAVLANETLCGNTSNLPQVTGASCGKVLGKICF